MLLAIIGGTWSEELVEEGEDRRHDQRWCRNPRMSKTNPRKTTSEAVVELATYPLKSTISHLEAGQGPLWAIFSHGVRV